MPCHTGVSEPLSQLQNGWLVRHCKTTTKESLVIIAVHLLLTLMSSCDSICDDEASVEIQKLATPMLRTTVDDSSMSSTDDSSTRSLSSTPKEEEERVIGKGKKKGKTKA